MGVWRRMCISVGGICIWGIRVGIVLIGDVLGDVL